MIWNCSLINNFFPKKYFWIETIHGFFVILICFFMFTKRTNVNKNCCLKDSNSFVPRTPKQLSMPLNKFSYLVPVMVLAPGVTPGGFVPAPLAYAGWHSDQIHVFDTCCKTWLWLFWPNFWQPHPKHKFYQNWQTY